VTSNAVGLSRMPRSRPVTAQSVFSTRYWFEVRRPDAKTYSAQMVMLFTYRHRSSECFIGDSMSESVVAVPPNLPIPLNASTLPNPTWGSDKVAHLLFKYLIPKSLRQ